MRNRASVALEAEIESRGLTHEQVEESLGLSRRSGQISRFIASDRLPGRSLAFRIETLFRIPMAWWEQPAESSATGGEAA